MDEEENDSKSSDEGVENDNSADMRIYADLEIADFMEKKLTPLEIRTVKMYALGYKYQEIADRLGTTVKAVGSTLGRVRNKFREYLELD